MNHPSRVVACPLRFSPCETGQIEYRSTKRFRGSSDEAKTICQRERVPFEGPHAPSSKSRYRIPRSLRSYENTSRIMDLDQWLLAVSLRTNDRIHSRVELSWGKRKTAGSSAVSSSFSFPPLPIVANSGRYYCPCTLTLLSFIVTHEISVSLCVANNARKWSRGALKRSSEICKIFRLIGLKNQSYIKRIGYMMWRYLFSLIFIGNYNVERARMLKCLTRDTLLHSHGCLNLIWHSKNLTSNLFVRPPLGRNYRV